MKRPESRGDRRLGDLVAQDGIFRHFEETSLVVRGSTDSRHDSHLKALAEIAVNTAINARRMYISLK